MLPRSPPIALQVAWLTVSIAHTTIDLTFNTILTAVQSFVSSPTEPDDISNAIVNTLATVQSSLVGFSRSSTVPTAGDDSGDDLEAPKTRVNSQRGELVIV